MNVFKDPEALKLIGSVFTDLTGLAGVILGGILTAFYARKNAILMVELAGKDTEKEQLRRTHELDVDKLKRQHDMEIETLRRTTELEIANLKVEQDLRIEYDKDLHRRRIEAYMGLLSFLEPLAKYPFPESLPYERLKILSVSLKQWYFRVGGLLMTEKTREAYFDLQDGFKIVLQKRQGTWGFDATPESSYILNLRGYLQRNEKWNPSSDLTALAKSHLDFSGDNLPDETFVHIRLLGSAVRTRMAEDLELRRKVGLGMVNKKHMDRQSIGAD
ncbi:MAG: hypothetical protein ACREJU_04290 [Nitrospiraceae bacterium]